MDFYGMTDKALLKEIGQRLRTLRLNRNLSQEQLADSAGISRITVGECERGGSVNMLTMVQILRALDQLENLDALLPAPGLSPLQLAKLKGKARQRASGSRGRDD